MRDGPILGVSGDYHDAAAALVVDGEVVAAAQQERFSRTKHDPDLPREAMAWCLEQAGVVPGELAAVAFHGKPLTTYERILRTHARVGPAGFRALRRAVRSWTGRKLWVAARLEATLGALGHPLPELVYVEHHLAHGASAFYPSPFERAAVLTFDGVGEWATTSVARGVGDDLEPLVEIAYPDSLGLLYSTITAYCGFDVNDGESKLMGLAPYGRPTYEAVLRERVIELRDDGSFRLDPRWFAFDAGEQMFHPRLAELLGGPPRRADQELGAREADLACSVQRVLDDAVLGVACAAHERTGERDACLAGGVALNCVTNARLLERGPFRDLWVQPAAGDAGGSLGAALWCAHVLAGTPRPDRPAGADGMSGAALGPSYDVDEVGAAREAAGVEHQVLAPDDVDRLTAADLAAGAIVGWFQGRMEFGPRALGHRSILADPRRPDAVTRINAQVKGREGFRPLAPAVLDEHRAALFAPDRPSPYMLATATVVGATPVPEVRLGPDRPRAGEVLASVSSPIPACTHVDGSARVQTVDAGRQPRFHRLLAEFHRATGCPALVNTSFNRAGEPIVCTPAEALATATACGLDALVIGDVRIDGAALRGLRPADRR